jgi:diadenosine tetraphosphate (Ap4A) HIT family hydrolase
MTQTSEAMNCVLCDPIDEALLWNDDRCRVVSVVDPDYPGFCRVVWKTHVAEMTDLDAADRTHLLTVVFATERALRTLMRPHKINLASLGNVVPHLHWHVIPRFVDDRHFPEPIWGSARRVALTRAAPSMEALCKAIAHQLNSVALPIPTPAPSSAIRPIQ